MTHTVTSPLRKYSFVKSLIIVSIMFSLIVPSSLLLQTAEVVAQSAQGPSAFCHVTEGTFTDCNEQTPGLEEWSDIQAHHFEPSNTFFYVNQNAEKTRLFVMFDFLFRTTPLASNQAVRITFDTVETENNVAKLKRYDVDIYGGGTVDVFVFGERQPFVGIIGRVGFGPSPNSSVPHLMAELHVPLTPGEATYSSDPLFWSSSVPPPLPPPQQGRFTQQQKEALAKAAADLNINAAVGAAVAASCLADPDPSVRKICAFAAGLSSGLNWVVSALLSRLVLDPADPNFTVIAQPVTPILSQQPITAGDGITQQQADAMNIMFTNLEQSIGLARAMQISIDRAQGAREAGEPVWENNQLLAAKDFAQQLATLIQQQPGFFAALKQALETAGFQQSFTANSLAQFQSSVAQQGFPSSLTQEFGELGVDGTLQEEIRQAFLNKDSRELALAGGGKFPDSLRDPALLEALFQVATNLFEFAAPAINAPALKPSLNVVVAGDYAARGVGLRDRTEGTIALFGIPANAKVVQAYLYWGMLDNTESPSLKHLNFNGTPITGARIGAGPDTCWGRIASFTFRADVTSLVSGEGSYAITGVASGGAILAQGATLVAFYEQQGVPLRNVILMDGNVVFPQVMTNQAFFRGFFSTDPVFARTTFIVGDGQTEGNETGFFAGSAFTAIFVNPFQGSDGPLWDTDTFDVSAQIAPGNGPSSAAIAIGSDCLMWVAQIFSITTTPPKHVPNVRTTAAVVEANEDGITTVSPTGLFPINEPSLEERVFLIVRDRLEENPGTSATELTEQLVNSLVDGGLLPPEDAAKVIAAVLERLFIPVVIDIKPGGVPNSINTSSNGNIPVAILSSPTFSAPSIVNRSTLTFGRTGNEQSLLRSSIEDVNADGRLDIICHFETRAADFQPEDTTGVLKGFTNSGQSIRGTDSVRIISR